MAGHPGGVGQGDGVVAPQHDRDRPAGGDRVTASSSRASDVSISPGGIVHVAHVDHGQLDQRVDAERQVRAGAPSWGR